MADQFADLVAAAQAAERMGRASDAERLWAELAARAPGHPKSLWRQAKRLIEGRNPQGALDLLERAGTIDPSDPEIPLTRALALRLMGDPARAIDAVNAALVIDPYHFVALLSKGSLVEQARGIKAAARIYKNVLKIAPPAERLPPALANALKHAASIVEADAKAAHDHLVQRTAVLRAQFAGADLARFDEGLDIYAGLKKPFVHEPILFNYPKLPAYTFYDRKYFPWLPQLESATDIFRSELEVVLKEDWEVFKPYINLPPGAPINNLGPLNNSPAWSTYFLWKDSVLVEENARRCPKSVEVLRNLPMASQPGFSPTAMFSVLQPKTAIPPHTGSTNVRLVCHLPLILPGQCRFRCGNDVREWKMGEAFIFDDSIEHEAWNDSDRIRVVLIIDVWNPLLSDAERTLVSAMMTARNEYYGGDPAA